MRTPRVDFSVRKKPMDLSPLPVSALPSFPPTDTSELVPSSVTHLPGTLTNDQADVPPVENSVPLRI